MNRNRRMNLQLFAVPENEIVTTDLEPAISIDVTSNLNGNITELQNLLGVTDMQPMSAGTLIKMYSMEQVNTPEQVAEGEVIPLTKIKRKLAKTVELKFNKFRKQTTAESIQKVGRNIAVNQTDENGSTVAFNGDPMSTHTCHYEYIDDTVDTNSEVYKEWSENTTVPAKEELISVEEVSSYITEYADANPDLQIRITRN